MTENISEGPSLEEFTSDNKSRQYLHDFYKNTIDSNLDDVKPSKSLIPEYKVSIFRVSLVHSLL